MARKKKGRTSNAARSRGRRNKQLGYRAEKMVAEFLNLKRTGATGNQIYDLVDSDNNYYNLIKVEVKAGQQVPALVTKAFSQIMNHIRGNQIPVVVMVPDGVGEKTLPDKALVILHLKDFKTLINKIEIDTPEQVTIVMKSGERFILHD